MEQSVLGAVLLKPAVLDEIIDQVEPGDFYREAHRKIYQAMMDLYQQQHPVDLSTVNALLKDRGNWKRWAVPSSSRV
jgi:replicative DNA helicase